MTETTTEAGTNAAARTNGSGNESTRTGSLTALRLPQLQAMASEMGIKSTGKMRKSDLIAAIKERGSSGSSAGPGATNDSARRKSGGASERPQQPTLGESASDQQGAKQPTAEKSVGDQPNSEKSGTNKSGTDKPGTDKPGTDKPGTEKPSADKSGDHRPEERESGSPRRDRGNDDRNDNRGNDGRNNDRNDNRGNDNRGNDGRNNDRNDNRGNDNRGNDGRNNDRNDNRGNDNRGNDGRNNDRNDNRGNDNRGNDGRNNDRNDNRGNDNRGNDNRNDNRGGRDKNDNNRGNRRGRSRVRDRKRRGSGRGDNYEEVEIREDDVLLPVAGILDVHDNYAFVRTSGYLPGANDVYVSMGQIKKNRLRKGDAIVGAVRQPREGENNNNQRQKFNALVRLDSVNGMSVDDAKRRVEFGKLTPLYPQERLRLETEQKVMSTRIVDLVAPVGKGQRGLIVAPPKAGKTLILQAIANAISKNNPEVHLMVVLVDERPEEVTDMQRTVKGEVIASTFDRPADDHTTVAELAIERAKRLVEMGSDVVVLLDSITRLGRAYNMAQPASGRILSGGVDANALYPPKRFFGAARNIEGGGSLTILATALVETGSKGDEVIFEEFKGTGNSELRLSRQLADKRIFPAVDVNASSTRREENLMSPDETKVMWKLRRVLSGLEQQQAVELLLGKLKETGSNIEFLMQVQKTTPLPKSAADD
ncbi:transcription termination factor Rho [Spelaeicoccus albus]|uniref:transcription termination factor Rho n=1 Tax=Spelaeicoccus albus TaxID=1280376 RepID=UPI003FD7E6F9